LHMYRRSTRLGEISRNFESIRNERLRPKNETYYNN
jgi:hypothetical protein